MRSTLLILATLAIAIGLFLTYRVLQPTPVRAMRGASGTVTATRVRDDAPHRGALAGGERPWIRNIDRLGRLASRFRARDYEPQPDERWVHVVEPQAEFYQYPPGRVQRVCITGKSGDIEVQQTPGGGSSMSGKGASGPPKRGWLKDVMIQLFPDELGPSRGKPSLTLVTDNINFDNERFVVRTAETRGTDGSVIPADQVPIHVTGDYDFEGRGLTLIWNDLEGRLDDLHIAHGEYLTINHPGSGGSSLMGGGDRSHKVPDAPTTAPSGASPTAPEAPAPPAPAPLENPSATAGAGRKRSQPPYTASFERDVRISQGPRGDGEVPLASADHMSIEFMLNQARQGAAATQPAGSPGGSGPGDSATSPGERSAPGSSMTSGAPTPGSAATRPAVQPVTVRWAGELVIEPQASPTSLRSGESVVHMVGVNNPVHVNRDGRDVHCAALDYNSPAGDVAMAGSPAFGPVLIRQAATTQPAPAAGDAAADESVVTTQTLHYNGSQHIALLEGSSEAQVRLKPEPSDAASAKPSMMQIKWQRLAQIYLRPGETAATASDESRLAVDHAHFEGDVDVQHPQLTLQSQTLDAEFDSPAVAPALAVPATQPAHGSRQSTLRHLIADDAVKCRMIDEAGRKQNVECRHMTMDMGKSEGGKLYPQVVNFAGDPVAPAHAFDATQDIRAGRIRVAMIPTTHPTSPTTSPSEGPTTRPVRLAEVDTVNADEHVRITTADGASADAEHLSVKMVDGSPHARLTGEPGTATAMVRVIDARKNVIVGPVIITDPKQNISQVQGPGSMHLIRQASAGEKPRPVDVTFKTGAVMDVPRNSIDIADLIAVRSVDPDGTVSTGTGQRLHITLADKPVTATATSTALAHGATTRPSVPDGMKFDGMRNKVVSSLELEKNVVLKSRLTDPAGALLQEFELKSEKVRYAQGDTPNLKGRLVVPLPGQMLIRDYRSTAHTGADEPSNSRGSTAFQWAKDLTYDAGTNTAVFTQDVWVVHLDDQPNAEPARLHADQVTAVFEPKPKSATRPATQETGDPASHLQLKSILAMGNVTVTRSGSTLSAPEMKYDPSDGWMNAIGTDRIPARFVDETGTRTGTGQEIDWNARTWEPRFKNARMSSRPPRP